MSDDDQFPRTLDDAGLRHLLDVERVAPAWPADVPAALRDALSRLPVLGPVEAEQLLKPLLEEHGDAPEIWWGLALAMVRQDDLPNASTCYENFRDRVEISTAAAQAEFPVDPRAALVRLRHLAPALVRCRDHALAVRGLIMASGLELMFEGGGRAALLLRAAHRHLRSIWPRPWALGAEWLATVAIAAAGQDEGRRPERSLRLALRLARHDPDNRERIAAIGRDLGSLLNRSDRLAEAEAVLARAMADAQGLQNGEMRASIAVVQAENFRAQRRYAEAFACLEEPLATELPGRLRALALLARADLLMRLGSAHRDPEKLRSALGDASEAADLLEHAGLDPQAALRDRGIAQALLGDAAAARRTFFDLLRAQEPHRLGPSERVAISYIACLIRLVEARPRKALRWAEYRLRTALASQADRPRDILLLREHCVAAAERIGDVETVRRHASAMLKAEAAMLHAALDAWRGPADWNRMRLAREALSILAFMEAGCDDAGARWRQAAALLAGRGLARSARRAARDGRPAGFPSIRAFARRLAPGERLLALVSMHPPAPVDPAFPWASGFLPARLVGIVIEGADRDPMLKDLGDFAACAGTVERWLEDLAVGRRTSIPAALHPVADWLRDASSLLVLAEGIFELVPVRLLAGRAVIRQLSNFGTRPAGALPSAPLVIVAEDMLEARFAPDTNREIAAIEAALPDARLLSSAEGGVEALMAALASAPRQVHIIAHGRATLDPRATELDVYQGATIALGTDLLTASRIADLRLEGVELVILSSCDTAAGAAQHAEGLASMAAAFLDAGAAAAISTLWPVPHEETASFMELLYQENLVDPAAALACAQHRAEAMGLDHACWAAFVTHIAGKPGQTTR